MPSAFEPDAIWADDVDVDKANVRSTATGLGRVKAELDELLDFTHSGAGAVAVATSTVLEARPIPEMWGAVGDGTTDDTTAIANAFAAVDVLHFGEGKTYRTDRIILSSGKTLIGYGATLKLLDLDCAAGAADYHSVLDGVELDSITVIGLTIDGNKDGLINTGGLTSDENGGLHGIRAVAWTNLTLIDVTCQNCWTDGIQISDDIMNGGDATGDRASGIRAWRVVSDGNRRQGLSITDGTDFVFDTCEFTNTGGQDPEAGVDLEPNSSGQSVDNGAFVNCRFNGNVGWGLVSSLGDGETTKNIIVSGGEALNNTTGSVHFKPEHAAGVVEDITLRGLRADGQILFGRTLGTDGTLQDVLIDAVHLTGAGRIDIRDVVGTTRTVVIRNCTDSSPSGTNVRIFINNVGPVLAEGCTLLATTAGMVGVSIGTSQTEPVFLERNQIEGANAAIFHQGGVLYATENIIQNSGNGLDALNSAARAVLTRNRWQGNTTNLNNQVGVVYVTELDNNDIVDGDDLGAIKTEGTSRDFRGDDHEVRSSAAITLTVPPNSTTAYLVGHELDVVQTTADQLTLAAGTGVTINTPETLLLAKQHARATLKKVGADAWDLVGYLTGA